jgi:type VI protein secretion system component Hcp
VPIDSITLNFAKIEYEYKPQKTKGGGLDAGIKFGWDVKKNVKA